MSPRHALAVIGVFAAMMSASVLAVESSRPRPAPAAEQDGVAVYFSPGGGGRVGRLIILGAA